MKSFKKIILCLLLTCTLLQTTSISTMTVAPSEENHINFFTGGGSDNSHD